MFRMRGVFLKLSPLDSKKRPTAFGAVGLTIYILQKGVVYSIGCFH